jgi:polysaccharide export outer membrane protein
VILQSSKKLIHRGVLITCLVLPGGFAQQQPAGGAQQPAGGVTQQQPGAQQQPGGVAQPPAAALEGIRPTYVLGPGDQVILRAYMMEEISGTPYRINSDGDLVFPVLGTVRAGGLTVEQLEANLTVRLRAFVLNPQVTVTVAQFRSEPVFFVGAFRAPGIYPLQGRRTLLEMLQAVGGLQPNTSRRIKVTRRKEFGPIPLPNAADDTDGKTSTVEISIGSLRDNVNPAEDIVLQPYDVISVERAEMVYVNGNVGKIGGFELGDRESITLVQLIAMAGGLSKDANAEKALVLRPVLNTSRRAEIPINLKKVLRGQASDFALLPNDLLYVPSSSGFGRTAGKIALIAIPILPTILYFVLR